MSFVSAFRPGCLHGYGKEMAVEEETLFSHFPGSKDICQCHCNRVNTSHSQGTSSLFSLHPLSPPLPFLWRPHCSLPSAKVGEFPWQQGSWCLDTVKDALQWSCKLDSPRHPLPTAVHPEHLSHCSLPFHLLHARMLMQGGISLVVLGEERHWAGGQGEETPRPLDLGPDKAQRQLGRQNWGWLSSEDFAGSEDEAVIQAWTKVMSHGTGRSCYFFPLCWSN